MAKTDAPNVVIVLLDDVGFGASAPFGGLVDTPALAELADHGLRCRRRAGAARRAAGIGKGEDFTRRI